MNPFQGFETVTIASLYWEDLEHQPGHFALDSNACPILKLPKAKDSQTPSTLVVYPMRDKRYVGNGQWEPVMGPSSSAQSVANDLVNRWANNRPMAQYGKPAIWICAGKEPTPEEIKENLALQTAWCKGATDHAESLWRLGNRDELQKALKLYVAMARFIGAESYEWAAGPVSGLAVKKCMFCATSISLDAVVCPNCRNVVDPVRKKAMEEQMMAAVAPPPSSSAAPTPIEPPLAAKQNFVKTTTAVHPSR